MAIEFLCPACRGTLSMGDDAAGKLVRCGNCLATLRVPDAAPAAASKPDYEVVEPARPKRVEPVRDGRGDRDEHGEPRARRPKRKSGRSPLFWIMIVLLALGLFTCLACGGGWLMLAQPRWQKVDSAKGGFTVEFPAPINKNIVQEAKLQLKDQEQVEGTVLVGRVEFYWVWYTAFQGPWRKGVNDDWLLDEVVRSLTRNGSATMIKETPKTVDGCAAREVILALDEGQTHHCLIVVGKANLYVATAGGPFVTPEGNPRIRRYLDSFHVK